MVTNRKGSEELTKQTSYSDVNIGPPFDTSFDTNYHAIEVLSDGDVEVVTGAGNTRKLALVKNRIYPIEIAEVVQSGTQVSQSEIYLYAA